MKEPGGANQQGAVAVIVAVMLAALFGFVGLALDVGNLVVTKTKMQNAVDAAACSGGLSLPNQIQATAQAKAQISSNDFDPNDATVNFTQDPMNNPTNAPQINCSMSVDVPTFFMGVFGMNKVLITVSAEGILQNNPGGPFDYTIFSGSPTDTLTLNGSQNITGSVHANDELSINGSSTITGAAEGVNYVRINGSSDIGSVSADTVNHIRVNGSNTIGSITGGAHNIDMPDYTQQIINIAAQQYSGNKVFNGSVDIAGSIYVTGNVTLNGSINTTGAILATGNITVNGSSSISGANQVFLYSANGDITINGSSFNGTAASAVIYAPHGRITINGAVQNFQGRIVGYEITINGSGTFKGNEYPVTTVPGPNHVKLIR